jgi:hypothetical protein
MTLANSEYFDIHIDDGEDDDEDEEEEDPAPTAVRAPVRPSPLQTVMSTTRSDPLASNVRGKRQQKAIDIYELFKVLDDKRKSCIACE